MNDFLKVEYEQCLDLVKYYDDRHQSLVKYASAMSSSIPTLLLAIFQLGGEVTKSFWQFTSLISAVTTIGLLALFTVLVQTRLYFVYPARQVNAIRKASFQELTETSVENQMYLDTCFNAFSWTSSHTLLNAFVSLQIGAFASLTGYSILIEKLTHPSLIVVSIFIGIIISACTFGSAAWYLYTKSKMKPDVSIHKCKEPA